MKQLTDYSLKAFNTFHVEARAADYVRFDAADEIVDFLGRHPLGDQVRLVLGGGSNLLFVDDFDGIVMHPLLKGIDLLHVGRHEIQIRAMAGENWDDLVAYTVANGWGGLENLSLIPGSVGASAVQNIGAYGVEVETIIERVETVSLERGEAVVLAAKDCGFGYRFSHFRGCWDGQFMVTAVVFRLRRRPDFILDYPGVRAAVATLGTPSLENVRRAIIAIRQGKLPDPAEIGNAGSYFKNPIVDRGNLDRLLDRFPDLPHYPQAENRFKLAAGWLIEHCRWKGRRLGQAAVHDRQALVLVNLGQATGREIFELGERVRRAVLAAYGVDLEREVRVVGNVTERPKFQD